MLMTKVLFSLVQDLDLRRGEAETSFMNYHFLSQLQWVDPSPKKVSAGRLHSSYNFILSIRMVHVIKHHTSCLL